jgi:cell fate regulator YaaT (PSP1 superfamily)
MSESQEQQAEEEVNSSEAASKDENILHFYRLRFRKEGQEYTVESSDADLAPGTTVLVRTEHCPEPGVIVCRAASATEPSMKRGSSYVVMRRASKDEKAKYARLPDLEEQAASFCQQRIDVLRLPMHLIRVERFFNGSKVIFYFTAESRVDFRELVKNLVQEFRTRVEMRQIGVRHETQMTGGIGACGRELCCTSFLRKFESVSIKMAKTQDLPLNPAKISGVCNRLLCCLTYEFDTYKSIKREMPRIGNLLNHEGVVYRVIRIFALQGKVHAVSREAGDITLSEEQWRAAKPVRAAQGQKKGRGKGDKKAAAGKRNRVRTPKKNKKAN